MRSSRERGGHPSACYPELQQRRFRRSERRSAALTAGSCAGLPENRKLTRHGSLGLGLGLGPSPVSCPLWVLWSSLAHLLDMCCWSAGCSVSGMESVSAECGPGMGSALRWIGAWIPSDALAHTPPAWVPSAAGRLALLSLPALTDRTVTALTDTCVVPHGSACLSRARPAHGLDHEE